MTHNLITGGAGFIGSHLAEALIRRGDAVTVIDDLSTGRWDNLEQLHAHGRFRAVIASAADRALVDREVERADRVFHLASAVGVKRIIERPVATVDTIYQTTDVVLAACSRYRRPVLLTSTSEVYGKSAAIPFREDADVVMGPTEKRRWAYACAKALDEFLALAHFYETGLPVKIARLFNTVGPRQSSQYGMVLPRFVELAVRGQPLPVYGDGAQTRCFCSVHDVVQGLITFMESPKIGLVINFGTQAEVSILNLAKHVISATHEQFHAGAIEFIPYEKAYGPGFDDMQRRVPSLDRAHDLGWKPTRTLDEIIYELVSLAYAAIR